MLFSELRLHSSVPKLNKLPFNSSKRPSVPTESLKNQFDSDYCSYGTLNNRLMTNNSKSPKTPKDPNLKNLKLKLINFLKLKKKNTKTEYFEKSSVEKNSSKPQKSRNFLNNKVSLSTRFVPNDYLLGNLREISKSFRKRQNIENLKLMNSKLESTNASSNLTNSKENQCKNLANKKKKDPKEEIYKFFWKKNRKDKFDVDDCDADMENVKKLIKSMQSLSRSENSFNTKSQKVKGFAKVFLQNKKKNEEIGGEFIKRNEEKDVGFEGKVREIVGRVKNFFIYYKAREKIYENKIGLLEQKIKDLQRGIQKKGNLGDVF